MEKTDTQPAETATDSAGGGKTKVVIVGFISFVVVFETALFFFLVPSAEEISALAEARLVQTVQKQKEKADEQAMDQEKVSEFALGEFGETFSPIDTERTYRVELRIYGLVRNQNHEKLKAEYGQKEGRLRHAIRMKIRNSEISELSENQLGLLQRRILTTSNHLLEGDLLLGIGFNDYQLVEE